MRFGKKPWKMRSTTRITLKPIVSSDVSGGAFPKAAVVADARVVLEPLLFEGHPPAYRLAY